MKHGCKNCNKFLGCCSQANSEKQDIDRLYTQLQATVQDDDNEYLKNTTARLAENYTDDLKNQLVWAESVLAYDLPLSPGQENSIDEPQHVAKFLGELLRKSKASILLESAYLVTGDYEKEMLSILREKGVHIKVLTNSMSSNDVITNHAAYARNRKDILAEGVELFELRPDAPSCRELVSENQGQGIVTRLPCMRNQW